MVLTRAKRSMEGDVDAPSRVEGEVILGKGSVVRDSILRGPLVIGARCTIEHSYIGPFTAIHDDGTIRNSEIRITSYNVCYTKLLRTRSPRWCRRRKSRARWGIPTWGCRRASCRRRSAS